MNISPPYKIVFLIPIFEAPDCVEDLIKNIKTLCPNSGILFHVNYNSSDEFYNKIQKLIDHYSFCYLFPKRYPSDWGFGYLAAIYIEMMNWCLNNLNFDYIYQTASNSLLINPKLEQKIYEFDGYCYDPGIKHNGDWWDKISQDTKLFEYIKDKGNQIYVCITEGMALNKAFTQDLVEELIDKVPKDRINYPSEEYWIPTAVVHLRKKYKYKNRCLEKWAHGKDEFLNLWLLPVDRVDNYVIDLMLDDQFDILSNTYCFSLKKINRAYDDLFRKTIRDHFKYHNELS